MKFGLTKEDITYIKKIIASYEQVDKSIIFGSRAIGNFKEASDIDIALKGRISFDLISSLTAKLQDMGPLPYLFDIISYEEAPLKLREHIDQFGIELSS